MTMRFAEKPPDCSPLRRHTMPMVAAALMFRMSIRLPVGMAAVLIGIHVPATWKAVPTVPVALSMQPRSPTLGPVSPGKWVTKRPGKLRVAASRWSWMPLGFHTTAIEGKPALHIESSSLSLNGAGGTGAPKRRKTRSSPMYFAPAGLTERSMYFWSPLYFSQSMAPLPQSTTLSWMSSSSKWILAITRLTSCVPGVSPSTLTHPSVVVSTSSFKTMSSPCIFLALKLGFSKMVMMSPHWPALRLSASALVGMVKVGVLRVCREGTSSTSTSWPTWLVRSTRGARGGSAMGVSLVRISTFAC